jgi:hypothetical protein
MKLAFPHISNKDIPTILITIAFLAAYIFGVWYVRHLEGVVHAQALELAAETRRETSMRSLAGFLAELSSDEDHLSSFFIAPDEAVLMIERVEGLGALVGVPVSISDVRIKDENADTGEGTMVMSISGEGTWRQTTKLIALLDELPSASLIESAMLVRGGKEGEDGQQMWSLRVTLQVFLRR